MITVEVLAVAGFLLSVYALWVKMHLGNAGYRPVCDINRKVSCSRAFGSRYGSIAFLPNAVFGLFFYPAVFFSAAAGAAAAVFYLSLAGVVAAAFLACLLYFRVRSYCLVCSATYLVNILLLFFSYLAL